MRKTLFLLTLTLLSALAAAQFQIPATQPRFILLFNPKVREHLKVTDLQFKKIKDALGDTVEDDGNGRMMIRLSGNIDMTDLDKDALKPLDAKQADRFEQLYLQRSGLLALSQEAVAKRLELNKDQARTLDGIVEDYRQKLTDLFADTSSGSEEVKLDHDRLLGLQKAADSKIEGLLTDEQKAKWKSMLGEKFDFGQEG